MHEQEDEVEELLNLEECNLRISEKPEKTLIINGEPTLFLCDTGACRTVMKHTEGLTPSNKSILVKSANGHVQRQYFSNPVSVLLPDNGLNIMAPIVMAPGCPYNLLGRDLMVALGLAIFPTLSGGMEARPCATADIQVHENIKDPYYEWTLDPILNDS